MPIRLLMVAARCYPFMGGIGTHIHEVGPCLVALGHAVDVLTTDPTGKLLIEEEVRGMRLKRVRAWPKERDFYVAPQIYAEIQRGNWDLIHFQGYNTFVAPIGLLAASRRHIPIVLTFQSGGHSSWLRNAVRGTQHALLRPLVARAAQLIGVSEFEADFFSVRMDLPRERFVVVPNGAAMPAPSPGSAPIDPHLIVSIGRLERYKGHHRSIAAMPELISRLPDARLRVVGAGPYEGELRGLVRTLNLGDRVTIEAIPGTERQRLADLLASAGLVVLLSEYEAHPVALMETLSLRRPALVSDTSGLRELAAKGLCRAIPLQAGPGEVAAAMAQELEAKREVPDLALPDWDACAQALSGVYENILNGKVRSSHSAGRYGALPSM